MEERGIRAAGSTAVVQGFGNVGSVSARLLNREAGLTILAVSDSTSAIFNGHGLDLDEVEQYKRGHGNFRGYPGAAEIDPSEILELDCTVLVPAALEGQIHAGNADRVRAQIIAEGANGPTTPEADDILAGKGLLLIPDILANAGGVTVSYFEWVQDLQAFFWEESEINKRLHHIMSRAYKEVSQTAQKRKLSMRTAAYALAVDQVARATEARGIYP